MEGENRLFLEEKTNKDFPGAYPSPGSRTFMLESLIASWQNPTNGRPFSVCPVPNGLAIRVLEEAPGMEIYSSGRADVGL